MVKNCEFCGKQFEAKRVTAKYCSASCRRDSNRYQVNDSEVPQGTPLVDPVIPEETPPGADANQVGGVTQETVPYDREANLKAFQKMGLSQVDWISTGIPDFDKLTQIPRGRVTQIQGPYGVGKTTLCLNMIKGLRDKRVLYIDSEASLNPQLLVDLEIDHNKFHLYNKSPYFEDISKVIRKAVSEGKYEMIIFDSFASTTTRAETEGEITDRNIGQKAFMMHKLMHMVQGDLRDKNTALVIINQERDKIGTYYPEKYTPGGNSITYPASLMIQLKTTKSARFPAAPKGVKKHVYQGHEVEATIIKSKVNQPWRSGKFKLYYPNPSEQEVINEPEITIKNKF